MGIDCEKINELFNSVEWSRDYFETPILLFCKINELTETSVLR